MEKMEANLYLNIFKRKERSRLAVDDYMIFSCATFQMMVKNLLTKSHKSNKSYGMFGPLLIDLRNELMLC